MHRREFLAGAAAMAAMTPAAASAEPLAASGAMLAGDIRLLQ